VGIIAGGQQKLDPGGFANGSWGGTTAPFGTSSTSKTRSTPARRLRPQQKSARSDLPRRSRRSCCSRSCRPGTHVGGITEIKENPFDLAPFVTRDSMYKYVLNTLDAAARSWQQAARRFRSRSRLGSVRL
jgi:hypothetical protein